MALFRATHDERRVHVDIVTSEVKRDQALEDDGPPGEGGGQEDQQARGCASVRHHVEDRTEARALLVVSRGIAVEGVEEAGDAVEQRACSWVQRHVVEGSDCEDDSNVACQLVSNLI